MRRVLIIGETTAIQPQGEHEATNERRCGDVTVCEGKAFILEMIIGYTRRASEERGEPRVYLERFRLFLSKTVHFSQPAGPSTRGERMGFGVGLVDGNIVNKIMKNMRLAKLPSINICRCP
jgi:hypothetical protein